MSRQTIDDFLTCLRDARFYDAHEVLEAFWFPRRFEDCDEVRLIKGFINAAVSFELRRRGRPGPSQRAWETYLKYRPLLDTLECEMAVPYRRVAETLETMKERL
jgi:hypothetical protein